MKTFQIELLVPEAEKLLDELVNLKLIKIKEKNESKLDFQMFLDKLRNKKPQAIDMAEVDIEVEKVRKRRYNG
jgi:hypothetical protein